MGRVLAPFGGGGTDVLHRFLKGATYEEDLEGRFGEQNAARAYCSLETRIQGVEESLHETTTAVEQLSLLVYPTLAEDHIRKQAKRL
jgi:hypothetical protein